MHAKKRTNSDLKKVYASVFKKGYEKVYTSFLVHNGPTEEILQVLASARWKNKKVLDVGCGVGQFAYMAAQKGAIVTGIDFVPEAIGIAQSRYQHQNLNYKVCDATKISGTYDIIVSIGTIEHMTDPLKVLQIFKKHLNPSGQIILTSPNWANPRGHMLMTLYFLLGAPITLADLHYFTPMDFEKFAQKLRLNCRWKTIEHAWGHGDILLQDFKRRIPNVMRDLGLHITQKQLDDYLAWIERNVVGFEKSQRHNGALGVYTLSK